MGAGGGVRGMGGGGDIATSLTFHSISILVRLIFISAVCAAKAERHFMISPIILRFMDSRNSSASSFNTLNAVTRDAFGHSTGVDGPSLLDDS